MDHSSGLKTGLFPVEPALPYLTTSLCECWSCELGTNRVSIVALSAMAWERSDEKVPTRLVFISNLEVVFCSNSSKQPILAGLNRKLSPRTCHWWRQRGRQAKPEQCCDPVHLVIMSLGLGASSNVFLQPFPSFHGFYSNSWFMTSMTKL